MLADQKDRDAIITRLDDTLVVEAAAGTGKTTELVRRIIRIIETGRADIGEIVAVTFTEKAAGELKLRLREALEKARSMLDTTIDVRRSTLDDQRSRIDGALGHLEEAHVSTIHGFCADLLRERPVEAGIDPLFTVLTEGQALRLYAEAFRHWMEEQLTDPPEGVRRSLRRPTFSGFGASPSEADEGPIDRLKRAGWELIQWRDFTGDWTRRPFDRRARIDSVVLQLKDFVELLTKPAASYDNLFNDCRPARQLVEDLNVRESVVSRDYDRVEASLIDLGRNRDFRQCRKGSGKVYREGLLREDVWQAREKLMESLASFEQEGNADLAWLLHKELRSCIDAYEAAKTRAGALDFLDLLVKARNLIRDDKTVRGSFQQRFQRIFVDEFQDTDPLQAEIILLLAAADPSITDWTKAAPVPGKLFIVGDPKQSIYRFRRADVAIYRHVYELLKAAGAIQVTLQTSFRARPNIQRVINAAFALTFDTRLPLQPFRSDTPNQPSVVVLSVPKPYGTRRISNIEIEKSLPDAVGAYVDWLLKESGWRVAERPVQQQRLRTDGVMSAKGFQPSESEHLVPIQARHICLLFRRFVSYEDDMTRPYVNALEARGISHLLVGGRSFHNRAEIETLRAALAAVEWPDDELSVFATLRGSLFAIGDEDLLEYRHRFGGLHPFRIPQDLEPASPIASALKLLQALHRARNRVPVAATISSLLEATRAHVGFALEHGGEQVLANVSRVADLARRYEADGGISFRGFLDELREQAEAGDATEAPILEEGSDGVRLMTVHKAKGLEFPVVILVDMTAKLHRASASRYLDAERGLCAVQLAGCSPADLIDHEQDELQRDAAEGSRLAYVAATRARDLLVIPAVGDAEREGWIQSLNSAIYPPAEIRRQAQKPAGCGEFKSKDSVLLRPDGDPANANTVCPGLYINGAADTSIVWWDPHVLNLGAEPSLGIRRPELIVKDVASAVVESGLKTYKTWRENRDTAAVKGSVSSIQPQTAAQFAGAWVPESDDVPKVEIIELPRADGRPTGRRFGSLVHAVLASVPLDAGRDVIDRLTRTQGRILGCPVEELSSAAEIVLAVLAHPLLRRAHEAAKHNRCRREVPISLMDPSGRLLEGVIDIVFDDGDASVVVDFKTDEEIRSAAARYERQVRIYAAAVTQRTSRTVSPVLLRV